MNFMKVCGAILKMHKMTLVLLGCIYRSPNSSYENTQQMYTLLMNDYISKYRKICIVGDFNYPSIKWNGEWTGPQDNELIECIRDAHLTQMVSNPTRRREGQRSNILNLILVNEEQFISNIEHCSPIAKSDHEVLLFTLYTTVENSNEQALEVRYDLNKSKYHAMRESIAEIDWIEILQCTFNVDQCWKIIKGVIVEKMEKYIPTVKMS